MTPRHFIRFVIALATVVALGAPAAAQFPPPPPPPSPPAWLAKLGPVLKQRAFQFSGSSFIVARAVNAQALAPLASLIQLTGGTLGRPLGIINGRAARVPNWSLALLAASGLVQHLSLDRLVVGTTDHTGATVGAVAVRQDLGFDGSGVGVAVIDSGVTPWHDDLADPATGTQRVTQFVDFVNNAQTPYDDYGHGSHVAGIIAGNGFDSDGGRTGIAPGSSLIVLKALDAGGNGNISNVIAAIDYAVTHKDALNIRVINLSMGASVSESYNDDPLTLATKSAVSAGIVVIAAAGNRGRDAGGHTLYGGITAPGNAPWVITVGASSHMGTADRADDVMGAFSSRGPTPIDHAAKPDLVAPGVGIESLSNPNSAMYASDSAYLLSGTVASPALPYLSLSGTSMAAPVVAGTVALMLQANPSLTPNAVKAILQYTAQSNPGYDPLTQGAGFLNAEDAAHVAQFFASPQNAYPSSTEWGAQLLWGNQRVQGGQLRPAVNAWPNDVPWGATTTSGGQNVEWGVICSSDCDNGGTWAPWRAGADSGSPSQNVVWGSSCGGGDCQGAWSTSEGDGVVWGTTDGDGVVWGTSDGDGVVWGTASDGDGVVWGTSCSDPSCQPIVWTNQ
jgi:serine protease AprX